MVHPFLFSVPMNGLITLPVHALAGGHVSNQVNNLIFNQLDDILVLGNQAGNQASNQARAILNDQIHERIGSTKHIEKSRTIFLYEFVKSIKEQSKIFRSID